MVYCARYHGGEKNLDFRNTNSTKYLGSHFQRVVPRLSVHAPIGLRKQFNFI